MMAGIEAQVELLRQAPRALYAQAQEQVKPGQPLRQIYLAGCGDSYYCGLATRLAFQSWTGLQVEALESLEFSRYVVDFAPPGSLLVAVSNSGRVARTVESVLKAKEHGIYSIGLSYNREGRLNQEVDAPIFYSYPDVGFGPGTLSYLASLLGLYALALHIGVLQGRLTEAQAQAWLDRIEAQADVVQTVIESSKQVLLALGKESPLEQPIFLVGGGPNYGSALFGMAKMIEAARHNSVAQELEEWAHEQYFCTGPGTLSFVWAPPGRSVDRAREQLAAIRDVGGRAVVFAAQGDQETLGLADWSVALPEIDEILTPIAYVVPIEVFAYAFASSKGLTMLGFNDPNRMAVNFRQIFGSRLQSDPS